MAQRLWSNPENPPNWVAERLGMPRWLLGDRLHRLKEAWGLGGTGRVNIWDDGTVTDDRGDVIGNVHDED
jgi:hypothetical protein